MTVNEIVDLANRYIAEGYSVNLFTNIYNSLVLEVFEGSPFNGGEWRRIALTPEGTYKGIVPPRKYSCDRKFTYDGTAIGLTACPGKCIKEVSDGEFVDYEKICKLKGA